MRSASPRFGAFLFVATWVATLSAFDCTHASTANSSVANDAGVASADATTAATWTAPVAISTSAASEFGNFGKAIATDGAGYIDVAWLAPDITDAGPFVYAGAGTIAFAQSGDDGATWQTSTLTKDQGATSLPKITANGSDIYIVWPSQDPTTNNLQIYLLHGSRAATDITWSAPTRISDTPTGENAIFPVIAATDSTVHVAWSDSRNAGVSEVYYASSVDKGSTWSTPAALTPIDGFNSWTPSLAADSTNVYLGWTDARLGKADCTTNNADCHEVLYTRSSQDSGQTWGDEIELTCDASIYTYAPSMFATPDGINIAFFQGNPAPPGPMSLYYLKGGVGGAGLSACAGTKGTLAAIAPQYPAGDTILSAWRPNISVANSAVQMVWWGELTNDYAAGAAKVYYASSPDGIGWSAATSLTPQANGASYRTLSPNIATSPAGTKTYVIWDDHRDDSNATNADYRIYFDSLAY